jgi:hypothetical protein
MKIFKILLCLLICSCSVFNGNDNGTYKKNNDITNPFLKDASSPWENIKSEGSDFALQNKKSKSIFLFNSACRKFEASSLNALTSSLLTGIDDIEIIKRSNINFKDREAQEIKAIGKVDGVKTFFNIVTLQKNYCIYDYVIISTTLKKLDADYEIYKSFINRINID